VLKSERIISLYRKVKKNIGCGKVAGNLFSVRPSLSSKISIIPFIPKGTLIATAANARYVWIL